MRSMRFCLALGMALVTGCSVLSNTAALPESERTVLMELPYTQALERVEEVLRAEGYDIEEASSEGGLIRTAYRRDSRLDALTGSAWSQVEVLLEEAEKGTRVVLLVRGRYSGASPSAGREPGEIPQSDQRAVLEDLKRALQDSPA
jgi:hypothetical protein